MKFTRRDVLFRICGYSLGLLLPSVSATARDTNKIKSTCDPRQETLKIIRNIYGPLNLTQSDEFTLNFTYAGAGIVKLTDSDEYAADNSGRLPFKINLNPEIISGPIILIIEKYNRYWGTFLGSEHVAQYNTNGRVPSITFTLSEHEATRIKVVAVTQQGNSLVYSCRQVTLHQGEDGCC